MPFSIPSPRLKPVEGVKAPAPLLAVGKPFDSFNQLRQLVIAGGGHDFLAVCGDIFRYKDFHSAKSGVADRSWHKTGRAFDYNQDDPRIVVVPERADGRDFFRTFIRTTEPLGESRTLTDMHGRKQVGRFFDFTRAASSVGYYRIPAWKGWERAWNLREFWHYQCDEGLSWSEAMAFLYDETSPVAQRVSAPAVVTPAGGPTAPVTTDESKPQPAGAPAPVVPPAEQRIMGRNDRGTMVKDLQNSLRQLALLHRSEVDGVFGLMTFAAVKDAQRLYNKRHPDSRIGEDGLVGADTRRAIRALLAETMPKPA